MLEFLNNEEEVIKKFLEDKRQAKVDILVPKRGEKVELLRMVKKNALDMLNKYSDRYKRKIKGNILALEEIENLLGLKNYPRRIEAYDISNTYGVESVGSMVVFEDGVAKKSDYRKFKI